MRHPGAARHLRQLDGLRALAVAAVFVEHWLPPGWVVHRLLPWGAGVKLFFVLSGFLITGILLDCRKGAAGPDRRAAMPGEAPAAEDGTAAVRPGAVLREPAALERVAAAMAVALGREAGAERVAATAAPAAPGAPSLRAALAIMRRFWARRFLRIFPAFYAVAITAALCGVASARATLPFNLTYTTNFHLAAAGAWQGEVSHFWSLAVEEQFYLVWPWVILLLPLPAIRRLLLFLVIAAPAFRWWAASGVNPVAASVLPPACFDTLGAGALLALARRGLGPAWFGRLLRPPFPALAVAAAAVLTAVHLAGKAPGDALYAAGLDLALALAFAALVARAADGFQGRAGALLGAPRLVYLGTISYGLYLLHNFVPGLIGWAPLYPWMRPLVYPFVTAALAAASWRFFEEPINRAKRFFPYERLRPSSPAPPLLQPHLVGEAGP
jgi:peptidoglycan/LPS O-acetylase OafA/YrhL